MKRFVIAFWVVVLALLGSARVWAGTPYSIEWAMVQENPKCETAALGTHDGDPFFDVNGTPLPSYEVPGAFTPLANGWESNLVKAGFDSVLLRMGANNFYFGVANTKGQDHCVHQQNVVNLVSVPLGINKPLFLVRRDGTTFSGSTKLELSLAEINPPLARDIANLEVAIDAERKELFANAAKTEALMAQLDLLRQLDLELHDLVQRPLDEITEAELDAILDRYADVVDEETQAALKQLLADLKQSVIDLQNELASLIDNFGAQADAVADVATQGARAAGFDPDAPSNYGLGPADVPWVEIPDLTNVPGAFEPGNDPYDAYANAVIAAFADTVDAGKVIDRATFVATVRAWRANQAALEKALLAGSGVTQAETNAFLKAQNKVTNYVRKHMDASDWFLKSPVPPELRAYVDGVFKQGFGELAEALKDALNQWDEDTIDVGKIPLVEALVAFGGAMSAISDDVSPYLETMATLVHATTRIGVGFVPVVGTALDLCEAVTGREWCLPDGKELSTEERIAAGVGVAAGRVVKVWNGVKNAGVRPGAKIVAAGITTLGEEFVLAVRASKVEKYKNLKYVGVVTKEPMNDFEKKAGLYLMKDKGHGIIAAGDGGVRKVLDILPNLPTPELSRAPDFISLSKEGGLVLSEAKGVTTGEVNVNHALSQLKNAMTKLIEYNLAADVERVQIIKPAGAKLGGNFTVKDGYLINGEGKTVTMPGKPNFFVRVVEI
jgi:hypothetical protein